MPVPALSKVAAIKSAYLTPIIPPGVPLVTTTPLLLIVTVLAAPAVTPVAATATLNVPGLSVPVV